MFCCESNTFPQFFLLEESFHSRKYQSDLQQTSCSETPLSSPSHEVALDICY